MKLQIDDIPKENRVYFKEGILKAIEGKGNIHFTRDKAIVKLEEPYIVTEQSLIEKYKYKKAIYTFIQEFRLYQFNQ